MHEDLHHELTEAKRIALDTWGRIARFYGGEYEIERKESGPTTEADHVASRFILAELKRLFPDDGVLSEEEPDNTRRFECERVWIVDPIDGTNGFISQSGDFAIQIGLTVRRGDAYVPVLGVVYHPPEERLYFARTGGGAWVEEAGGAPERLCVSDETEMERMTAVVTRSHRTSRFLQMMEMLEPRRMITMGSLGLKVLWVAMGRADYYLNNARGMCSEWDVCAPHAILNEAGGTMTHLAEGTPIRYNCSDVCVQGGVLISNSQNHDKIRCKILEMEKVVRRLAGRE